MAKRRVVALAGLVSLLIPLGVARAAGAATEAGALTVIHVGQVDRQDVASRPGSEPDTVVEPDVAVSPVDPDVAVAAAHDSRYPDGGAVDISTSWTADGGATWHHAPVPDLTTATGGVWDRASDPVVQYGADGSAYLSALVFDSPGCATGVAVLRSVDGGRTWGPPVLAQHSTTCAYSDDKNWLVVDNAPASPYFGRVYQFWTAFISRNGATSSPQVVRWSDDEGQTWSRTVRVNPEAANTQDSQPLIEADGTIVDTYLNFGGSSAGDGPEHPGGSGVASAAPTVDFDARTSTDGGMTWGGEHVITGSAGGGATGVRCCLVAAAIDPVTAHMYAVWEGVGPSSIDPVELSTSVDGATWSAPVRVSTGDVAGVQEVNAAVTAYGGHVVVDWGRRTDAGDHGGVVQQEAAETTKAAEVFGTPVALGKPSTLRYAAQSEGYFPGDYIGAASTRGRVYLVWCRSSAPPVYSTDPYHQVMDGATLGD